MAVMGIFKRVGSVPSAGTYGPNEAYLVRVGSGFDLWVTNSDGTGIVKLNGSPAEIYLTQAAYDEITTPDPATRYYILPESSAVTMIALTGAEAEVYLTQAAYDAIGTPDPAAKYYVRPE